MHPLHSQPDLPLDVSRQQKLGTDSRGTASPCVPPRLHPWAQDNCFFGIPNLTVYCPFGAFAPRYRGCLPVTCYGREANLPNFDNTFYRGIQ